MLKDIRIHLDPDEKKQSELEKKLAERVTQNYRRNFGAFKAYVPNIVDKIVQAATLDISIFTNRNGELNIVNYSNGRTFYDLSPEKEVQAQYVEKLLHCTYCDLDRNVSYNSNDEHYLPIYDRYLSQPPLKKDINLLVVMGVGLGFHIRTLVENHNIKHLVIYEPEEQYFFASLYTSNWKVILETAKSKGTALYFQLNNSGISMSNDIEELKTHFPISGFYFYRHYNHNTFNLLENALLTSSWKNFQKDGISKQLRKSEESLLPHWNKPVSMERLDEASKEERFTLNVEAFKRYVPNIANEFECYTPNYWVPMQDARGAVNIFSKVSLANWYSDSPFEDASINFENFKEYPNKDGLILGYNGVKLKHYQHFQFVKKAEKLLKDAGDKTSKLPKQIKSLILFGIGPQLETLFENNDVEKLFLCEPNRDLFYASLYLIDWANILERIDKKGGRLYINVGDDGSNLFRDLLNQFYSVGPYILANTYFYQTYYNTKMVHTISQLREQLQVVIAMGENFDHARYGIAHTKETIGRKYPLLLKDPAKKLSLADKDIAVFIVGNGPSLDSTIDTIKSFKDKAIVVSCGTALMPLYKNGIVPDFHAEIEQNRSTFDWSCRVNDFAFLKQVDLLSCNGIHPDTCKLFRNTYIAFKEGESSTVSSLKLLGEKNYEELQFAYPTVSNFAINLFTLMGFQQLYLFGVDLGFAEQDKHHSKQSGYYDNHGKEKYSYKERHNTNILVPGNFKKSVFTKYEFKVSKAIIERTLAKAKVDCFNTSDGALIAGAKPLPVDDILLVTSAYEKEEVLRKVKAEAFQPLSEERDFLHEYDSFYDQSTLEKQLNEFVAMTQDAFEVSDDAEHYTEKLKKKLFSSYQEGRSLLFYYLYGTVNFANSAFSKLLYSDESEYEKVSRLNMLREAWLETLEVIRGAILQGNHIFDHVSSFVPEREAIFMKEQSQQFTARSKLSENDNKFIKQYLDAVSEINKQWFEPNTNNSETALLCDEKNYPTKESMSGAHVVVQIDKDTSQKALADFFCKQNTILYHHPVFDFKYDVDAYLNGETVFYHSINKASWTVKAWIQKKIALVILPKLYFVGESKEVSDGLRDYAEHVLSMFPDHVSYIDYPNYIMIPKDNAQYNDYIVDKLGNRGVVCVGKPKVESMFLEGVSKREAHQQIENNIMWWGFGSER